MLYALYKQWKRSTWLGFSRRLKAYIWGDYCYIQGTRTMRMTEQFRVGDVIRERWVCTKCGAGLGEIY